MSRRAAVPVLVAVAVLASVAAVKGFRGGEEEEGPPPLPGVAVKWKDFAHPYDARLKVEVPEAWTKDYTRRGEGTVILFGPEEEGHKPNLRIGWIRSASAAGWAARKVDALRNDITIEVFDDGDATVAGMRARYIVYGSVHKPVAEPKGQLFRHIEYYFEGHGHIGFVQGTARASTFLALHRPLFQAVAARMRFEP